MIAGDSIFFFFLLIASSAMASGGCVHPARAGYLSSLSVFSAGACGYGPMALGFNGGYVAAATSTLYRGGVACGACFQVRCKNMKICHSEGVKVILTDLNEGNGTELILSRPAFMAMAQHGMAKELKKLGTVDVEYMRIPCEFGNKNLSIRVEEKSQKPNYLAIKFLYQGGQTDIVAVDIAKVGSAHWQSMSRVKGPMWSTYRAPTGPLQIRLVVTGGYDGKWVWVRKETLTVDWTTGSIYDLGVQISDIAEDGCSSS
ncbi:expansin-like A2 [Zingiber officinale]|uniref:expansin-like A2 n=1 Tax=Zingiber officinale TaxID=94328 RepID=UPI001C4B3D1F|nr:expansin-like A2 [Zingiber officinale]